MGQPLQWHTEKRKVKELKLFEGNPRRMTTEQASQLLQSLKKFNLVEIPAIDQNNRVIAGNMRIQALKQLGRENEEIEVRVPNRALKEEEAREYLLRSNKNIGDWDWDLLANFSEEELNRVGFESEELDKIFDLDLGEKEDEVPEPRETNIKYGDIFQLGNHRVMCGDATKKEDVEKLMNGEKIKLCFTSPPYNMASNLYENYADNLKSEEFINLHLKTIYALKPFLKGFIFWNVSYNKNARWEFLEIIHKIVKETGLRFLELIIWDKGHGLPITSQEGLTRSVEEVLLVGDEDSIQQDLELFIIGTDERKAYFNKKTQKGITNYWKIGTNKSQIENLKACFPVALPQKGIELMTQRGDNVYDPFGGSGSTLIACEKLNRRCYMMEIEPIYCQVIIDRWEQFTGKRAEKWQMISR